MPPLTNVAITTTADGPVGAWGRNVLAYDLTTGALVASCELPAPLGTGHPGSILSRPSSEDLLVSALGATAGGVLHRLDRSLTLLDSTDLALPPGPPTDLWRLQVVRSDFQGGLYVGYQPSVGTATGDQLLRQLDPVTFAVLDDWQTFVTPDARDFLGGDFSLDGQRWFFVMSGGPDPNQHVIHQLTLPTSVASTFTSYGSWSGGVNPTGDTYRELFLRPRADGTYVVATFHVSGTDGNTQNAPAPRRRRWDGHRDVSAAADRPVRHAYVLGDRAGHRGRDGVVRHGERHPRAGEPDDGRPDHARGDGRSTGCSTSSSLARTVGAGAAIRTRRRYVAPSYHLDARYIRRLRRAPHVNNDNTRVFLRRFELDLERGQGLATGQGSDPMVLLRLSRDGGQTWGEEIRMAAGALGAYTQRVLARRLGHARDTVFEVTVSDPIAWSLVGAWLDVEGGTS